MRTTPTDVTRTSVTRTCRVRTSTTTAAPMRVR